MIDSFHIDRAAQQITEPRAPGYSLHSTANNLSCLLYMTTSNPELKNDFTPQQLLAAIRTDAPRVKGELLLEIHISFLRLSLKDVLASDFGKSELREARATYVVVLEQFLLRYVQPQVDKGGNLSRRTIGCNCNICWDINLFLASGTRQVGRFALSKNARHHVHAYLDRIGFDGTHTTERTHREQQTLVVTTRNPQRQAYDAWLERCRRAHQELQSFRQGSLKKSLRDDYERIMSMEVIISDSSLCSRLPSASPNTTTTCTSTSSSCDWCQAKGGRD
jgi:hypothetical protein